MRILFVGNSHTYFNDMPALCAELLRAAGQPVQVAMLSKGGESFAGHIANEQTRFNLLYGGWDWVILQQVTSDFPPLEKYLADLDVLRAWCAEGGSRCALYMNFASPRDTPPLETMQPVVLEAARRYGMAVAPAGVAFARVAQQHPEIDLYAADRHHASPAGSYLVALTIVHSVLGLPVMGLPARLQSQGHVLVDLTPEIAQVLQEAAQAL